MMRKPSAHKGETMGESADTESGDILYHNDYSPRYRPLYNIYDKARDHIKELKREKKAGSDIESGSAKSGEQTESDDR